MPPKHKSSTVESDKVKKRKFDNLSNEVLNDENKQENDEDDKLYLPKKLETQERDSRSNLSDTEFLEKLKQLFCEDSEQLFCDWERQIMFMLYYRFNSDMKKLNRKEFFISIEKLNQDGTIKKNSST